MNEKRQVVKMHALACVLFSYDKINNKISITVIIMISLYNFIIDDYFNLNKYI